MDRPQLIHKIYLADLILLSHSLVLKSTNNRINDTVNNGIDHALVPGARCVQATLLGQAATDPEDATAAHALMDQYYRTTAKFSKDLGKV